MVLYTEVYRLQHESECSETPPPSPPLIFLWRLAVLLSSSDVMLYWRLAALLTYSVLIFYYRGYSLNSFGGYSLYLSSTGDYTYLRVLHDTFPLL